MTGNKKSFTMNMVASKSFSFIMNAFDYAVTFLFRIKQKVQISIISSAILKSISNITLKKIKMTISSVKFIGKQIQPITIKKIKLGIVIRETGKIVQPLNIKYIKMNILSSARQKLISAFTLKKIKLGFVGTYGTFYTLGQYDPQTLGTMDTQTLGQLDFVASP